MTTKKAVYKNPQPGQPLITTISSGCRTPVLEVKFSTLVNPFYYPNSPTVARYSLTCIINPSVHGSFLQGIQTIEKNEKVETVLKNETRKDEGQVVMTGNVLLKFQQREKIPLYLYDETNQSKEPLEIEDEFAPHEKVIVEYDIMRYTKKNSMKTEHGISFRPTAIFYLPSTKEAAL